MDFAPIDLLQLAISRFNLYLCFSGMEHLDKQTISDLGFNEICDLLAEECSCDTARERMLQLKPLNERDIEAELLKAKEFLRIRTEETGFPRLEFEELTEELNVLKVKDHFLSAESFMRIKLASMLVNQLLIFFDKRDTDFPFIYGVLSQVYHTKD
ncbi:MAG: hypothetical protein IH946_03105, partial [Bacteroidetes bacterium]|nr:hypothetical protein [Bacteroidota bacterium]